MDQNSQNIALIKNLGTARPTLSFNFIFDFLGHFSIRHILFFKKSVDNFEMEHKTCWILVRGAVPP